MSEHNWIDSYLHTHYMGCIQGRYDIGCRLYLKDINSIAIRLGELRAQEGLFPEPLPKVERFMKEALGQQIVDENIGFLKDVHQENETLEMLIQ